MKYTRKMMLVPFKETNDEEFSKIINKQHINTPVKLDLINKRINLIKNNKKNTTKNNIDSEQDAKKIKNLVTKNKTLKTLEKLNKLNTILNNRLSKLKSNKKNVEIKKENSIEIKNEEPSELRLIKTTLKRKLPTDFKIDTKVASIDTVHRDDSTKKRKTKNLQITKSSNLNYIPSESMELSDSDDEDIGTFTRYANKPILLDNQINTRNRLKNWSTFQQ
jgi:hypothetical protein